MKTPVLTKKQQKLSLSARKQKRGTIKNVLASPYASYWPALSDEDNAVLLSSLEKHLPKLQHDKVNVPWKALKNVPKPERKKAREAYLLETNVLKPPLNTPDRSFMKFGVNDVAEGLEQNNIASVLIASDVIPRLLVKHVIDMSVLKSVPILIVNDLRNVLKNKCGISSIAVGLKTGLPDKSALFLIQQEVEHLYQNYPVPKNHINYPKESTEAICVSDENEDSLIIIEGEENTAIKDENVTKNYLLIRTDPSKRVFVPEMSKAPNVEQLESTDFLEFCKEKVSNKVQNTQQNDSKKYKSLIIKRLKGDSGRTGRKIQQQKRKKHQ